MFCRLETVSDTKAEEISVSDVDDVVMILKCDYENAYFVTGTFFHLQNFVLWSTLNRKITKGWLSFYFLFFFWGGGCGGGAGKVGCGGNILGVKMTSRLNLVFQRIMVEGYEH